MWHGHPKFYQSLWHSISPLLYKLDFFGIWGSNLEWVKSGITQRSQYAVLNGSSSDHEEVKSGVPQGTMLGPFMFLIFIGDISEQTQSLKRLFADDCLLYRTINKISDSAAFQQDMDLLCKWTTIWQMQFNEIKCFFLRKSSRNKKSDYSYSVNNVELKSRSHDSYLGVAIQNDLKWSRHINHVTTKANKLFGCLRRKKTWQSVRKR